MTRTRASTPSTAGSAMVSLDPATLFSFGVFGQLRNRLHLYPPPRCTADANWSPTPESGHVSGQFVKKNIYVADLTGQGVTSIPGLRQDGQRAIRARFPNANPELGFGSSLNANGWVPTQLPRQPDVEIYPLQVISPSVI